MTEGTIAQVMAGESTWTIAHGSMLDVLPTLAAESIDACVTDPPYGLGNFDPKDVAEALRCWLSGTPYLATGGGFMGRSWDAFVPGPECWREVFRVLKPGGHIVVFAGTRTLDLMGLSLRLAGFETRDTVALMAWIQGQGFPKSLDVSKQLDKVSGHWRGKAGAVASDNGAMSGPNYERTDKGEPVTAAAAAAAATGYGTALKPSFEPIIVARKPLCGTVAENWQRHGTGALNIDACRVAHAGAADLAAHQEQVSALKSKGGSLGNSWKNDSDLSGANDVDLSGRWPPNVVLQHSPGCQRLGTVEVPAHPTWDTPNRETQPSAFTGSEVSKVRHGNPTSFQMQQGRKIEAESVEQWTCVAGCPVRELATQSGESQSIASTRGGTDASHPFASRPRVNNFSPHNDSGTAARYFPQFQASALDDITPFRYEPKANRGERDRGLAHFRPLTAGEATDREDGTDGISPRAGAGRTGGIRNSHPTVKPVDLMRWLVRLVTPKGGVCLDPFAGSGTSGIATVLEGFRFVGVELNDTDREPFVSIARARIAWCDGVEMTPRPSLRTSEPPKQTALFGSEVGR